MTKDLKAAQPEQGLPVTATTCFDRVRVASKQDNPNTDPFGGACSANRRTFTGDASWKEMGGACLLHQLEKHSHDPRQALRTFQLEVQRQSWPCIVCTSVCTSGDQLCPSGAALRGKYASSTRKRLVAAALVLMSSQRVFLESKVY